MAHQSSQPGVLMISGANRGIGRAVAERCLADGYRLSLGCHAPAALSGTILAASEQVLLCPYEAREPATAVAWVAATVERFGGLDGVLNIAGVLVKTPFLFADGEEEQIRHGLDVNLMGPWWLTRAAWPHLQRSGRGRVINLASMSGKRVKGRMAAYPVSKFALMALGQAMANSGWEHGIRVTSVCPGWVNTGMAAGVVGTPVAAMTQPEDVAAVVSNVLQLPNAAVPQEVAINCNLER